MSEFKNERKFETLELLGASDYDSCVMYGQLFRIRHGGKTTEGKDYFYLDVRKDVLNLPTGALIEESQKRSKAKSAGNSSNGYQGGNNQSKGNNQQGGGSNFGSKFYG